MVVKWKDDEGDPSKIERHPTLPIKMHSAIGDLLQLLVLDKNLTV